MCGKDRLGELHPGAHHPLGCRAHLWSHRLCAGNDPVHRLADSAIPLPGLDHPCCTLRDADLRKRPGTGVKPHSPILYITS